MILWLASYPRSGNTYVRAVLRHLYGISTHSVYPSDQPLTHIEEQWNHFGALNTSLTLENLRQQNEWIAVKTHELPIEDDPTPALYIVRDGRDAMVSYAWHTLETEDQIIDRPFDAFRNRLNDLIKYEKSFGGWSQHVRAWTKRSYPTAIIKFEDLIRNPISEIHKAVKILGLPLVEQEVKPPLATFEELKQIHVSNFRRGEVGGWATDMPYDLHILFWKHNADMMHHMNYTDEPPLFSVQEQLAEQNAQLTALGKTHEETVQHLQMAQTTQQYYERELYAKEQVIQTLSPMVEMLRQQQLQQHEHFVLLRSQHEILTADHRDLEIAHKELLTRLQTELLATETEFSALLTSNRSLKMEWEQQQEELATLRTAHQALLDETMALQASLAQSQEEAVDAQSKHNQLHETIYQLEKRVYTQEQELIAKEAVIQHLKPFRLTSLGYWLTRLGQTSPVSSLISRLIYERQALKERLSPRLGQLSHHPPRPLHIPAHYHSPINLFSPFPTVTVVTPTYNSAAFVVTTVRSVLNQNYPALEYIVQDGASCDETSTLLIPYQYDLSFISEADQGQAHALNKGFARSHGEIMAYLNADDILLPGALHTIAAYFQRHPQVDVVYGHRVLINSQGDEIGRWVMPPHDNEILAWADYVPQETLFWRRRIWDKVGAHVDETFQYALDWDLLLRFQAAGAVIRRLPRFLGAFRIHPEQKTTRLYTAGTDEMMFLRQRALGRQVSVKEINDHIQPYLRRHVIYQKLYRAGLLRY